jgi:hypothetical protein
LRAGRTAQAVAANRMPLLKAQRIAGAACRARPEALVSRYKPL